MKNWHHSWRSDNNQLYHKWTRPIKLPIQAHCWNKSHVIEDLVTNSPPFFPWRERVQFQQYVSVFPHSLGLRSLQRNTAVVTQRHDSLLQCGMAAVGDVFVIKKAVRLTIILVCTSNETNPLDNQWAIQFLPPPHLTKPSSPNWTLRQAGSALVGIGGSTPLFLKSVGTSQVFKNSSVLILGNQMTNMWTRQCCFTAAFNNC